MRAVFAVVCFVAFYVIAVAAIGGLGWSGFGLVSFTTEVGNAKLMLLIGAAGVVCMAGGGVIAWSILPRVDRFEPPGPELFERDHPRLFAEIRAIAAATGQAMPVHVYAVLDANAFVTERGGFMGLGSQRVLGLGMGLLEHFSIDEVRAVIAHEFGHFDGGDTKLGPWIYKTRAAMSRTVSNLYATAQGLAEIHWIALILVGVAKPFGWMALGYVRLAQGISRAQEYSADAVAARVVGATHLISGFRKLAGVAAATDAYIAQELEPMAKHAVMPPFFEGLRMFSQATESRVAEINDDNLKTGEVDAFDSHPPISQRIAALETAFGAAVGVAAGAGDSPAQPARQLLTHCERVAQAVVEHMASRPLQRVEWADTAKLLTADWSASLAPFRAFLRERGPHELTLDRPTMRALALCNPDFAASGDLVTNDELRPLARSVYAVALGYALLEQGFSAQNHPGKPLVFVSDDLAINVHDQLKAWHAGDTSDVAWMALWEGAGLPPRPWATAADAAA